MNWKTIYVIVVSAFLVGPFVVSIFAALLLGIPLQQTLPVLLANVYPLVSIVGPPAFALYVLYHLLAPAPVFKQVRGDYNLISLVSLVTVLHVVAYFEVATLLSLAVVQGISAVGFSVFLANQLRSASGRMKANLLSLFSREHRYLLLAILSGVVLPLLSILLDLVEGIDLNSPVPLEGFAISIFAFLIAPLATKRYLVHLEELE
jgi:hypothetical protein